MDDRAVLIERAKLAEVAERYDDMAEFLKSVIEQYPKTPLNDEERNSFSVAYKNKVGARRSSWRCIAAAKRINKEVLDSYRTVVVKELNEICDEVLHLLTDYLVEGEEKSTFKVFYLKMKGDYYRYKAEVMVDMDGKPLSGLEDDHKAVVKSAEEAYASARECSLQLDVLDSVRLGLALNYSVFLYEIMCEKKKACDLAQEAFDVAHKQLQESENQPQHDSSLILQLLRDNLTFWNSENDETADS